MEEAAVEAAVEEEVEEAVEEAKLREEPRQEEETRNSLEQNHLPLVETDKTSTDSSQTSKDTCP